MEGRLVICGQCKIAARVVKLSQKGENVAFALLRTSRVPHKLAYNTLVKACDDSHLPVVQAGNLGISYGP